MNIVEGETLLFATSATKALIMKRKLENEKNEKNLESLMHDVRYNDSALYEGLEKEGHRII